MSEYVVIALSPAVDTSTVVGTFRSPDKALQASEQLRDEGYNTEICQVLKLAEVRTSPPWWLEGEKRYDQVH